MSQHAEGSWDARYAKDGYLFGTDPNAFLVRQAHHIPRSGLVLAVADGEGRNGVWLAQQGYGVHAIEASMVAIEKATSLAVSRGVAVVEDFTSIQPGCIYFEQVDVLNWTWPFEQYDAVVAIFIQFATPTQRRKLFGELSAAIKRNGVLLMEGYHQRQLGFGTGGPSVLEQLYDAELLRESFADLDLILLLDYDQEIDEGQGHRGRSALTDLVARKSL
ncbi:MAG: class I SAM-dependent methyltransferase [Actinomycetota bacterium]|nr:class I SAM-dependent methyltransferase [Actinomycetota bacterium]MDP2288333.1 class I SAM-dependent methyltransferase [Actinomycetota bacterium]